MVINSVHRYSTHSERVNVVTRDSRHLLLSPCASTLWPHHSTSWTRGCSGAFRPGCHSILGYVVTIGLALTALMCSRRWLLPDTVCHDRACQQSTAQVLRPYALHKRERHLGITYPAQADYSKVFCVERLRRPVEQHSLSSAGCQYFKLCKTSHLHNLPHYILDSLVRKASVPWTWCPT